MKNQDPIKNLKAIRSVGILMLGVFVAIFIYPVFGENIFSGIFMIALIVSTMIGAYFVAREDGKKYGKGELVFHDKSKSSPFIVIGVMVVFALAVMIPAVLFPSSPLVGFYILIGGVAALFGVFVWKMIKKGQYRVIILVVGGFIFGWLYISIKDPFGPLFGAIAYAVFFGIGIPLLVNMANMARNARKKTNEKMTDNIQR